VPAILSLNLGFSVMCNMVSDKGVAFALVGVSVGILGLALSMLGIAIIQESPMNFNAYVALGVFVAFFGVVISRA
jgi:hypothetical protein